MSPSIHAMTHGTQGLELSYLLVLAGMLAGGIHARAGWRKLLLTPLLAAPAILAAAILIAVTSPLLRVFDIEAEGIGQLIFGTLITAVTGYIAGRLLAAHRASSTAQHRRGAIVLTTPLSPRSLLGRLSGKAPGRSTCITLAEVPVPLEDETKHFKLIGTTGTGKSTAIRELLTAALRRGDRAVIADPDGGYLNHFHDPARGDVILNPFDPDARKWDPFGEIVNDYDIEQLARSLIPDGGDPDRIWFEYARTFFSEVMRQCIRADKRNDANLFRLLTAAKDKELRMMLAGTAAGPFLEEGNEKMFGSLRSVASAAVRALAYTTRQKAEPFSVRQWIRHGAAQLSGRGGVLFLPYSAGQIAALRSVISAWMRLAIFEAMDRPEGDQRLWFVVDELDALGEIDGLKDALARLRKFGGRCVLGFQSIAQVSGTYGKGSAETLVENCANTLILRCSASEHGGTSEFVSKLIGQREVLHTTRSRTQRPLQWLASTTTSQHLKIEPAVMASEIERLPDLAGFLKLASCPDWQSVTLRPGCPPRAARTPRANAATTAPRVPPTHASAAGSPSARVAQVPPEPEPRTRVQPALEPPPTQAPPETAAPLTPAPARRATSRGGRRQPPGGKPPATPKPVRRRAAVTTTSNDTAPQPPDTKPATAHEPVQNRLDGAQSPHPSP
ncbi:MAG TPA: type IV secretion system DNA-binding domain-containing protein [Steroidobacteraceae bacterium]|nr:type IV secretion system DNA-binding domain-containing protein [Steroidobacteraceae bacterium]